MLIVMDKSTLEEHLSQPLQTLNKQIKIALTILTGYNGIFNVTHLKKTIFFAKSITDKDCFIQITILPGAYELESSNDEIRRIIIEEGHFTGIDYPFTIKPNFSTLRSIIENSRQEPISSFIPDDSKKDILISHASTLYNPSLNPVDILSI